MQRKIKTKQLHSMCGKYGLLVKKEDLPKVYRQGRYKKDYDLDRVYHCKHCDTYSFTALPRYLKNKKMEKT
jgi:hypothetical protein